MPRITRIAGSFAIVVIAYWAYALLAVRWIEPPADLRREGRSPTTSGSGAKFVDVRLKQLEGLFPPDAWELKNPKILESDRAKLLFQRYKNFPDGRVELHPCTIVFPYEGPAKTKPNAAASRSSSKRPPAPCSSSTSRWTSTGPRSAGWWAGNSTARSPSAAIGRSPVPKTTC